MVDISLPPGTPSRWREAIPATSVLLKRGRGLLLAFLLALGVSFVLSEVRKDKCQTIVGKLAVQLKLDSYYSNCQCMTHSLDFSDACNSMFVPLLTRL